MATRNTFHMNKTLNIPNSLLFHCLTDLHVLCKCMQLHSLCFVFYFVNRALIGLTTVGPGFESCWGHFASQFRLLHFASVFRRTH